MSGRSDKQACTPAADDGRSLEPPTRASEPRWRELVLRVPDLRDRAKNQRLDDLLEGTLKKALRLMEG